VPEKSGILRRHAYLILVHEDPVHLRRLIDAMDHPSVRFFIHVDAKVDAGPFSRLVVKPNVEFVDDRVKVYWGGWSTVQATLNLITAARSSGGWFSHYTLMSGSHFPLKRSATIREFVDSQDAELLNIVSVPNLGVEKPIERFTRYHLEGSNRRHGLRGILRRIAKEAINLLPFRRRAAELMLSAWRPYAGSNWWTLSAAAIDHVVEVVKERRELVGFFEHVEIPDESFFHTILGNSQFLGKIHRADVFTDWSNPKDAPCYLRMEHLERILGLGFLMHDEYGLGSANYARKLGSRNRDVTDAIEKQIESMEEFVAVDKT
jgi:hypothetical protein